MPCKAQVSLRRTWYVIKVAEGGTTGKPMRNSVIKETKFPAETAMGAPSGLAL